jgi:hypothetical protein
MTLRANATTCSTATGLARLTTAFATLDAPRTVLLSATFNF